MPVTSAFWNAAERCPQFKEGRVLANGIARIVEVYGSYTVVILTKRGVQGSV
jgi:hypothetical protein